MCFKDIQGEDASGREELGLENLNGACFPFGSRSEDAWWCRGLVENEATPLLENGLGGLGWVCLGQEALYKEGFLKRPQHSKPSILNTKMN